MAMNVLTLKGNKKDLIKTRILISQAVSAALADPDFGMELTTYAKKRLRKAQKQHGRRISFIEIKRHYL